jgi:CheY-like chemotaxis protein
LTDIRRPESPHEPPPSSEARGPERRHRILVLDDSEFVREAVSLILEEGGYDTVTLDSPFGLHDALCREDPDLVLIDVGMPGMSGDRLVELTQRTPTTLRARPLVLFSARSEEELRSLARACGAAGFIRKGSSPDAMLGAIQRLLPK